MQTQIGAERLSINCNLGVDIVSDIEIKLVNIVNKGTELPLHIVKFTGETCGMQVECDIVFRKESEANKVAEYLKERKHCHGHCLLTAKIIDSKLKYHASFSFSMFMHLLEEV